VGTISTDEISVDVSGKSVVEITEAIQARADPNLILKVILYGLGELGAGLDTEILEQGLAHYFYHIECSDQSHPQLATISPDDFPEELVVGRFVRLMQERIEDSADVTQRRRAEQALQIGVALLRGRKVL
jgi:hypothetical protein